MKPRHIKRRHDHLIHALKQLMPTYEGDMLRTAQLLLHTAWKNKEFYKNKRLDRTEYYKRTEHLNRTIELFWKEERACLKEQRAKSRNRSHLRLVKS